MIVAVILNADILMGECLQYAVGLLQVTSCSVWLLGTMPVVHQPKCEKLCEEEG